MNAKQPTLMLFSTLGGMLCAAALISGLSLQPSIAQAASLSAPQAMCTAKRGESQVTSTSPFSIYLPAVLKDYGGCSQTPTLVSPANGNSLTTRIPLFQWNSANSPHADTLRLQVSRTPGFTQIVKTLNAWHEDSAFRFDKNFDAATTYYWRAFLLCGETQSPYSEVWSFTTGSDGTILPAPTLVAPANGSMVHTPVSVQWAPVPGAVEYLVHWGPKGSGGYTFEWVSGTQYTIYEGIDVNDEWWVTARNDYALGTDSEKWTFTTTVGTSANPGEPID